MEMHGFVAEKMSGTWYVMQASKDGDVVTVHPNDNVHPARKMKAQGVFFTGDDSFEKAQGYCDIHNNQNTGE